MATELLTPQTMSSGEIKSEVGPDQASVAQSRCQSLPRSVSFGQLLYFPAVPCVDASAVRRSSGSACERESCVSSATEPTIEELIHRRLPGMSLEREFYTSPKVFTHDMERIYFRQWLFAGHVDRVRKPGEYVLYTIAGESLIIIRGDDHVVRGFYNVCRHRGSRICLEEHGVSRRLVCPYHAWTYDTTAH